MGSTRLRIVAVALVAVVVAAIAVMVAFAGTKTSAQLNVRQTSLGKILVDSKGRTLYMYAPDKHGKSSCYGQCATFWPPLIKTSAVMTGAGIKASLVKTTTRTNGKVQLVYNGHPLYRFAEDTKAGLTKGQGLDEAGGFWWVLSPSGAVIKKTAASMPAPTTTAPTPPPGNGYGTG